MIPPDVREVPVENGIAPGVAIGQYFDLDLTLDDVDIATVDLAIQEPGETRPLTTWTAYPGPVFPSTRGEYHVFARVQGAPKLAIYLGRLIMF